MLKRVFTDNSKNICKIGTMLIMLILLYIFMSNNYAMYKETIATVKSVETKQSQKNKQLYTQKLTLLIRNGEHKNQTVHIANEFNYSQIKNTEYKHGDDVFITDNDLNNVQIVNTKRDKYLVLILFSFFLLLFAIARHRGIKITLTLLINIVLFMYYVIFSSKNSSFQISIYLFIPLFCLITIFILCGFGKKAFATIVSTLITVTIVGIMSYLVIKFDKNIPYELIIYSPNYENLPVLILAGALLSCLGAIMDISMTINTYTCELVSAKSNISAKEAYASAKKIGNEIMGTMIDIMFFTYIGGTLPSLVIMLKNGLSLFGLINYTYYLEILRFLLSSIAIVFSIPISIIVSVVIFTSVLSNRELR